MTVTVFSTLSRTICATALAATACNIATVLPATSNTDAAGAAFDGQLGPAAPDGAAQPAGAAGAGSWLACGELADAYCARLQACHPHVFEIDYASLPACKEREQLRCSVLLGAPDAQGSTATFAACRASIAAAPCDGIEPHGPPRCWFGPGKRAAGKACSVDTQCAGRFCKAEFGKPCGVCAAVATSGEPCSSGQCEDGLACVFDKPAKGMRCRAPAPVGGDCTTAAGAESACGYDLGCNGATCAAASTKAGDPCAPTGCDHARGFTCSQATQKCVAITMKAPGASCSMNGMGGSDWSECHDGLCLNQNDMGNGTCKAYAADGAPCKAWEGPGCRHPATCRADKCVLPPNLACAP